MTGDAHNYDPSTIDMSLNSLLKQVIFWIVHLGCIAVIWTGFSWIALAVCFVLYVVRMFAITGGYHRYFSHRSYKTSRWFQFVLAFVGASSAQKGPIWWASHHRHHHKYSDTEEDVHPPLIYGIWWAHIGWVLSSQFIEPKFEYVKDLLKFPELRWLEDNHAIAPLALVALVTLLGWWLQSNYPELNTSPLQMLVWGFCISTTLLYHGTFLVNSATHLVGKKRFKTSDESRNSFIIAILTLGEGWHNNHHRYPGSERQGFYWWEIDVSHYILKGLSFLGLVWDLRTPPERIYQEALENRVS
jgi:stearoyl-CoA desaturase (Delta-9 desaturase)